MHRYSRFISIILCISVLIGCMVVPAYAASDDIIHSYLYLDFVNPSAIPANSFEDFSIYGDSSITGNVIYLLCSRSNAELSAYVSSNEFTIEIEELWKNGTICCYRVKSNSARAFNREFKLRGTNSTSSNGVLNVYKVFAVAPSGIVELNANGLTSSYALCGTSMPSPIHGPKITSLPYVFESQIATNIYSEYYLDINIPISKFTGMQQGSFTAYAASVSQSFMSLGSYLISCSLLYHGSPIPYQYSTSDTVDSIGGSVHYNGEYSEGVNRPLGTYLTVYFDIPEQLPDNEAYITARFIYKADETPFHFYFQHLYGRYSFAKTEYELLNDIFDILSAIDDDINNVSTNLNSLKTVLHSDLTQILAELKMSNEWLWGIFDQVGSMNTFVGTIRAYVINLYNKSIAFFTDVGNWFYDLGSLVVEWGDNIVKAITGDDGGAAEEFKEDAQEQAGEVESGVGKIDAVQKPNVNDIDADPNDILDSSAVGLLAGTINIFFQNNVFYSIFSLVLLMMLASYVLFGKK